METTELRQIISEEINKILEANIGKFKDSIDIVYDIDKTTHANDRQIRHNNNFISDDQITKTINNSLEAVAKNMIFNKIDIGNPIHIFDSSNNLNIIATTKKDGDRIKFIIITVMIKSNCKSKQGTFSITI